MKVQIKRKPVPLYDSVLETFPGDDTELSYDVFLQSGKRPSTSSSTTTTSTMGSTFTQGYYTLATDPPKYASQTDILDLSKIPGPGFGSSRYTLADLQNEIQEVPVETPADQAQTLPPSKPAMGRARSQTVPQLDVYALPPQWAKPYKVHDRRGSAPVLTTPVYQLQDLARPLEQKSPLSSVNGSECLASARQVARVAPLDSDSDGDATDTEARARARTQKTKSKAAMKGKRSRAGTWSLPSKAQLFGNIEPLRKKSSSLTISFDEFWAQGEVLKADREPYTYSNCSEHSLSELSDLSSSCASSSTASLRLESAGETPPSSMHSLPTPSDTAKASFLPVISETGESIPFGALLTDVSAVGRPVKTIVCFIRHFLCPLCQDYMYSITRNVDPKELERVGVRLVVVGNGSWQMIKSYRQIFKFPFAVYTDPTAALYTALGMTLRTLDPGPRTKTTRRSRASTTSSPSSEHILPCASDTYVRHPSLISGISLVVRNVVKARMPIWRYTGDKALLGGEFIFIKSPGRDVKCIWAHRMQYTTGHEEIGRVVGEAGVCEEEENDDEDLEERAINSEDVSVCGGWQSCHSVDERSFFSDKEQSRSSYGPFSRSDSEASVQRSREAWVLQEQERWRRIVGEIRDDAFENSSSIRSTLER